MLLFTICIPIFPRKNSECISNIGVAVWPYIYSQNSDLKLVQLNALNPPEP